MELKITENKKNALLSRTDVQATITFEGATPTRKQVVKELAKQLKTKEELIIVRKIKTTFGNTTAKIEASAYDKKEVMEKVEVKRMIEKHNFKEEAKTEEKTEETPDEEKKEEAPKEEVKVEEPAKDISKEDKKEEGE